MNLPEIKIEDLLEAGVHFGHNVRRWNPKMEQYIFGVRNNIHIFDLRVTLECFNNALVKLHEVVSKSGKVLEKIEKIENLQQITDVKLNNLQESKIDKKSNFKRKKFKKRKSYKKKN